MNTGAVSQPIAAAEVTADRSRNAGRKSGPDSEGSTGFAGLLSKLASNLEPEDRQTDPARETPPDGGDIGQILDWLRSSVEAAASDGQPPDPEQEHPQPDSGSGGLTDIDVQALMQVLNGSTALAEASGLAAMVGRVANGTATKAETALMQAAVTAQEEGEALSPEQIIFASLAKAAVRTTEEPAGDEAKPTPVTLTVVGRETHLAPVVDAGVEWAARLAAEGRLLRAGVQREAAASGDMQAPRAENGTQPSGEVQLADPQRAVTPVRDGQLGNDWRRGSAPTAEPHVVADALTGAGDGAAPISRSDALISTSFAGGAVAHQIADRVASEAGTLTTQAGRPDAPAFAVKHEAAAKVLHLQLQPEGLGTVTIRMSVKDQALRLDLEVGRGETAHMIQRDRDALSALLRSAGYMIDGVEVRVADAGGANAQGGNGQANTPMHGGGQSGSSQPEGRSPGERSQDGRNERGNNAFGSGRNGEDEQARHTARSGGVYI
jgi:flagellar hook-length control protein FliK